MKNRIPPKFIIALIAIFSVLYSTGIIFAQEPKRDPVLTEEISDVKQEQAKKYRQMGLEYQQMGNLAEALSFYQKAVAIYPNFAIAYNDLGVVYEAMGLSDRAEENYLKCVKIDPDYPSVYTNLALLYENQRNLDKAALYWGKRAGIGDPDDPWKLKAAKRLSDIRMALSGQPFSDAQEEDVLGLMQEVTGDKVKLNSDDAKLVQAYFKKAKLYFNKGDMASAMKEALAAQYLDQDNPEIEAFIEKAELRALTR